MIRRRINGDGLVDILDLVKVAGVFSETMIPTAPIAFLSPARMGKDAGRRISTERYDSESGLIWLTQQMMVRSSIGAALAVLEQLMVALPPQEKLLCCQTIPNPFNPETWIPYRLAHAADVTLTIYDTAGALVRQLDLGYQLPGDYTDRAKAVYWDGRAETGEPVASGVYFYSLSAGNYSATRKMIILK